MLRIGIALFAAIFLAAQSPTPDSLPQRPSAEGTQSLNSVERGTEKIPLVVKVLPTQSDRATENTKDASEERLADLTGDLASYTFRLFIATAVLAVFTLLLVIVGFFQVGDAKKSIAVAVTAANAARDQVKLGRDEFIATFRPHLIVRNVHAIDAEPGDEIIINYELINNGTSAARVVASAFEINYVGPTNTFKNLHLPRVGKEPKNEIGDMSLIPSQVYRGVFRPGRQWMQHHFDDRRLPESGFFWGGKILYQDNAGNQRRLGVYRRFDIGSRRFRTVSDPEFEYDD